MHKAIWLTALLALAACGENSGWNPNYTLSGAPYGPVTKYGSYKVEREKALVGQRVAPKTIPVALPVNAPTPAEIAGPNLWQIIQRDARAVTSGAGAGRAAGAAAGGAVTSDGASVLSRFAAGTSHAPGRAVWPRAATAAGAEQRFCRSYASTDAAQIAFLGRGGPQADPAGADPDGDGYVCGWNPAPWRRATGL